mmetsp:Transcript_36568/g.91159  ORF Transcript_36568/g.91159 Transcript_36568/m.91159 type:complete len:558 (+) Transcript_36568:655-2328(+)
MYARFRIFETSTLLESFICPFSIASVKFCLNSFAVPRALGRTQSTMTKHSCRLFCTGVPVRAMRRFVRTCLKARASWVFSFLSLCASSTTHTSALNSACSICSQSAGERVPINSVPVLPSSVVACCSSFTSFLLSFPSSPRPEAAFAAAALAAFFLIKASRCLRYFEVSTRNKSSDISKIPRASGWFQLSKKCLFCSFFASDSTNHTRNGESAGTHRANSRFQLCSTATGHATMIRLHIASFAGTGSNGGSPGKGTGDGGGGGRALGRRGERGEARSVWMRLIVVSVFPKPMEWARTAPCPCSSLSTARHTNCRASRWCGFRRASKAACGLGNHALLASSVSPAGGSVPVAPRRGKGSPFRCVVLSCFAREGVGASAALAAVSEVGGHLRSPVGAPFNRAATDSTFVPPAVAAPLRVCAAAFFRSRRVDCSASLASACAAARRCSRNSLSGGAQCRHIHSDAASAKSTSASPMCSLTQRTQKAAEQPSVLSHSSNLEPSSSSDASVPFKTPQPVVSVATTAAPFCNGAASTAIGSAPDSPAPSSAAGALPDFPGLPP